MIRYAIPLIAAGALSTPVAAAEIQISSQGPVVELSVNEVVRSTPDAAQMGAGVVTRAATAQEAMKMNAAAMERVVAKMRQLGIKGEDIQTSNFNLNPNYVYNQQTGEQTFNGYNVSNQVSVTLRDLDRVGEILDALVAVGANNVFGPNFMLENDSEAKASARAKAFANGRQMAQEYARMAGYPNIRLLEVSETFQSYGPPVPMARAVAESADAKTPIEPGQVGTGVTVTVKYEMTR